MTETSDPWTRGLDYRKQTGSWMPVVVNDPRLIFKQRDADGRYVKQPGVRDIFGRMNVAALRRYPVILPVSLACTASIPGPRGREEIVVQITHLDFNLSSDWGRSSTDDRPVLGTYYARVEWASADEQMTAWLQASLLCGDKLRRNGRPIVRWTRSPRTVLLEHLKTEMRRVLKSARKQPQTDLLGLLEVISRAH